MGVAAAAVAIVAVSGIGVALLYNSLVRLKYRVKNGWSQIDVQLKRRHDLIPNLVETVQGYARHERATLEAVVRARSAAVSAAGVDAQGVAESALGGAVRSLLAVVEAYPELKASRHFLDLQEELTTTENRIGFARQHYNDEAERFNSALQTVPRNLLAGICGFQPVAFFRIEDRRERAVPRVSLTG
jgi:LemA protein